MSLGWPRARDVSVPRISKAHWDVLSPLFDELLDGDIDRRAARLAEIRGADENLADDLSALLAEHDAVECEAFLEGDAIHGHDVAALQGQIIGSYSLERPLGQGGMGTVWLAQRSDGRFEGQVAIKFLNLALVGRPRIAPAINRLALDAVRLGYRAGG